MTGARTPNVSAAIETARRVIDIEIEALRGIRARLGESFERAVVLVKDCKARTVITGMGKSGQICRKLAATLSSTGTSALFVHAAEAAHGDLGMFTRGDVCIAVSNSGTTEELVTLLPSIKRFGIPLIAMTGGLDSPLAQAADVLLDIRVDREACPLNLAPTASTAATLAMGDALAVAVFEAKGFTDRDFAVLHPGGALGRKLMRVSDVMHASVDIPLVKSGTALATTLDTMTNGRMGAAGVVDPSGALIGVVTDGDLRRATIKHGDLSGLKADDIMTAAPKTIDGSSLAAGALAIMEQHSITSLFIVNPDRTPAGIVHLHDLLRAGVA